MDKLRELLEKMYYLEDERKHKLYTNLQIRITILVLIFGVIAYYLQNLPHFGLDVLSVLFWVSFAIALLSVLLVIYFLFRSFCNYKYSYHPKPLVIANDIEKIKKYYKDPFFKGYEKEEIKKLIEDDINSLIVEYYKRALEINIANNDKRASYLHNSSSVLIATIIFLLSSMPFYFVKYYSNPRIQKVEIIDSRKEVKQMSQDDQKSEHAHPSEPTTPPPKPEPSPNRLLKEGTREPPKRSTND